MRVSIRWIGALLLAQDLAESLDDALRLHGMQNAGQAATADCPGPLPDAVCERVRDLVRSSAEVAHQSSPMSQA